MIRDVFGRDLGDVGLEGMRTRIFKVCLIGLPSKSIPFGGEYTVASSRFEAEPCASDTGEKVDKFEFLTRRFSGHVANSSDRV